MDFSGKTLLVTGGAGFIGSNFVSHLVETGEKCKIIIIDSLARGGDRRNLEEVSGKVEFVRGDIRNAELVDALVEDSDVIINFAAETHNDFSLSEPRVFFSTNVMGVLNLAQSAVKHNKRLHHISTDEVFGDIDFGSAESFSLSSPYKPSSPYSASKASSDHLVRSFVRSFGLRATISNCSNNYGAGQSWEKLIPQAIKQLSLAGKMGIYGDGMNQRDWIHVADHVRAIELIIKNGQIGETYLLGARDVVSNLEIVAEIASILNVGGNFVEFVSDRPGHDKKYSIDPSFAEKTLGWTPIQPKILSNLHHVVEHYLLRLNLKT